MKRTRGFALLGLVIALAVLAMIIAVFYLGRNGNNRQSTIENYVNDVQKAKDVRQLMENSQKTEQQSVNQSP